MLMIVMFMIGMRMLMGAVFTGVIVALAGCVPTMGVIMSVLMPMIVTVFVGVRMAMSFIAMLVRVVMLVLVRMLVRMTVRMRMFIDFRKFHGAASLDADPGSSRYCRGSRVRTQPPDRPAG